MLSSPSSSFTYTVSIQRKVNIQRKSVKSRRPLTRERILRTAINLADREGIEALSMRKLGHELGVEAMSLYNHVANKDELLRGILGLVTEEIELPGPGDDWKTAVRRTSVSAYETLMRHRWAVAMWFKEGGGDASMRMADGLLRALREGGFVEELAYHAYHSIQAHIMGYSMYEGNFPLKKSELQEMAATFLNDFPTEKYPYLAEHIEQHLHPPDAEQSTFAFGLDLLLDGLERLK